MDTYIHLKDDLEAQERGKAYFVAQAKQLWGDTFDFTPTRYLGAIVPTTVRCREHGDFTTRPSYILSGNGCPACGQEKVRAAGVRRRKPIPQLIEESQQVHGGTYDYSLITEYTSNKAKLPIRCPKHGVFMQSANSHLGGRGCPECSNDLKRTRNRAISEEVLRALPARLDPVNPRWTYDYSSYKGMAKRIRAMCSAHGPFSAAPNNIMHQRGCRGCGEEKHRAALALRRLTPDAMRQRVVTLFSGDLEVLDMRSVSRSDPTPVLVRCVQHGGEYSTTAEYLMSGCSPCPSCGRTRSRAEDAIFRMVSAFTPTVQRDRTLLRPKELDIYMPEKRLAVEYCGVYWHSAGDVEAEARMRDQHAYKWRACVEKGVHLMTIYETEWMERPRAVKRIIRAAAGRLRGRVYARKCELRRVGAAEARGFFESYHIQGGTGSGEHYGLYWNNKLVACMRFTFGGNDRGRNAREWTLSRYATRVTVSGGASRLFNKFLADHAPKRVKSFSDNRYFTGRMYEALGFVLEAELDPDYQVWSPKGGMRPKSHYQRRNIPARLQEHGIDEDYDPTSDSRSERDMTYLMGARRIYDCGKKRWVYTAP